jgi:hypothetical protein
MSAPAASDRYGAFAFPNVAGTELLIHHHLPHPERLHTALCDGGRKVAVRFVRRQTTRQPDGTREWPDDFNQLEGTVFQVLNQRLGPKSTCFIAEEALLTGAEMLRVATIAKPARCAAGDQRRLASLRTRGITACTTIAAVASDGLVAAVEWQRAGRDALASVIVAPNAAAGRGRMVMMDFPAEFTGEGVDLWRVEDEGHLYPDRISVPFLIRKGNALVVPLAWSGAEGVSLSLYVAESSAPAGQVISDYWYRAPR